ncbi:MAG: uncharacterized protein JWR79_1126 [Tardiphaga sp.]|jgi:hypothetical protein|nr:uncharacterized protein [Tardiphaga sp.]
MVLSSEIEEYERLLGRAALEIWSDMTSDAQELLFEAAGADNPEFRKRLAIFLHDTHPRTLHPPKP